MIKTPVAPGCLEQEHRFLAIFSIACFNSTENRVWPSMDVVCMLSNVE